MKTVKRTGQNKQPGYFIQGLQRGLEVIRAFDRDHPSLTVSEAEGTSPAVGACAEGGAPEQMLVV